MAVAVVTRGKSRDGDGVSSSDGSGSVLRDWDGASEGGENAGNDGEDEELHFDR